MTKSLNNNIQTLLIIFLNFQLCIESNLVLPVKHVGTLTVKPPDETFAKLKALWGSKENDASICPINGANFELAMTAAVSKQK